MLSNALSAAKDMIPVLLPDRSWAPGGGRGSGGAARPLPGTALRVLHQPAAAAPQKTGGGWGGVH